MKHNYGPAVKVEYFDLAEPQTRQQNQDIVQAVDKHDLPYPLVAINDKVRFAGRVDYYAIAAEIERLRHSSTSADS